MKSTTVPAQVTTVEDKIAGNLNLAQLLLLAASVFTGFALYILVPPGMKFSIPKILLCIVVMLIFASLAIRVRGRILALWIGTMLRYNLRPRYYVFNKNQSYLRDIPKKSQEETKTKKADQPEEITMKPKFEIPLPQVVQLETVVADPRARLTFQTDKKGALSVRITEIK